MPDGAGLLAVAGESGGRQRVERHALVAAGQIGLADPGPAEHPLDRPDVEVLAAVRAGHDRELGGLQVEGFDAARFDQGHDAEGLDGRAQRDEPIRVTELSDESTAGVRFDDVAAVDALLDAVAQLPDEDRRLGAGACLRAGPTVAGRRALGGSGHLPRIPRVVGAGVSRKRHPGRRPASRWYGADRARGPTAVHGVRLIRFRRELRFQHVPHSPRRGVDRPLASRCDRDRGLQLRPPGDPARARDRARGADAPAAAAGQGADGGHRGVRRERDERDLVVPRDLQGPSRGSREPGGRRGPDGRVRDGLRADDAVRFQRRPSGSAQDAGQRPRDQEQGMDEINARPAGRRSAGTTSSRRATRSRPSPRPPTSNSSTPRSIEGKTVHRISFCEGAARSIRRTIPGMLEKEKVRLSKTTILIDDKGRPDPGKLLHRGAGPGRGGRGQLQEIVFDLTIAFSKLGEKVSIKRP